MSTQKNGSAPVEGAAKKGTTKPVTSPCADFFKNLSDQSDKRAKLLGVHISDEHTRTRDIIVKSGEETRKTMETGFKSTADLIGTTHTANVSLHDRTYRKMQTPWWVWIVGAIIGLIGGLVTKTIIPTMNVLDQAGNVVGQTATPFAGLMPWLVGGALFIAVVVLLGAVGKFADTPAKSDPKGKDKQPQQQPAAK